MIAAAGFNADLTFYTLALKKGAAGYICVFSLIFPGPLKKYRANEGIREYHRLYQWKIKSNALVLAGMNTEKLDFERLYLMYKEIVYNTSIGYVQHIGDAEEITQDVFVDVYFGWENFKGQSSVKTWIYRIAVNRCIDFLKHKNRKKRFGFISSLWSPGTGALAEDRPDFDHPGVLTERKEGTALVYKSIRKLPENQKTAFILSKIEGLGNIEISEIMQLKVGAVESLLSRAKENLKKQLSEYYKN